MLLKNKVVLITGGSRGIGLATAEKCLSEGASVFINYKKNFSKIDEIIKKYDEKKVTLYKADITQENEVCKMIKYIKNNLGYIDGIVNNAGIITRTLDWKNISMKDWNDNINTNLLGSWNIMRYGVDIMNNGGSIVNISSIYGMFPEAEELSYSVSKAGVIAMTQALAKKLAPKVRVNAIAPGNTLTTMIPNTEKLKQIEEKTLLKRSARPDEMANAIAYLLSEQSSYITGSIISVDGGYHII